MIGPGYDVYVDDIVIDPGEKDTIAFSPDGSEITYTPSSAETPNLGLGFTAKGADYGFLISGAEVEKGKAVTFKLDTTKQTVDASTTNVTQQAVFDVYVERLDAKTENTFTKSNLALDPGATASIEYGKWNGTGDVSITIQPTK